MGLLEENIKKLKKIEKESRKKVERFCYNIQELKPEIEKIVSTKGSLSLETYVPEESGKNIPVYLDFYTRTKGDKYKDGVALVRSKHLLVACSAAHFSLVVPLFIYDTTANSFFEHYEQNTEQSRYVEKIVDFIDKEVLEEVISKGSREILSLIKKGSN